MSRRDSLSTGSARWSYQPKTAPKGKGEGEISLSVFRTPRPLKKKGKSHEEGGGNRTSTVEDDQSLMLKQAGLLKLAKRKQRFPLIKRSVELLETKKKIKGTRLKRAQEEGNRDHKLKGRRGQLICFKTHSQPIKKKKAQRRGQVVGQEEQFRWPLEESGLNAEPQESVLHSQILKEKKDF